MASIKSIFRFLRPDQTSPTEIMQEVFGKAGWTRTEGRIYPEFHTWDPYSNEARSCLLGDEVYLHLQGCDMGIDGDLPVSLRAILPRSARDGQIQIDCNPKASHCFAGSIPRGTYLKAELPKQPERIREIMKNLCDAYKNYQDFSAYKFGQRS